MRQRLPLAALLAAGTGLLAVGVVEAVHAPRTRLALFAAAVILAELFADVEPTRSRDPVRSESLRIAAGVHIAAVAVLGPWPAALLAAMGVSTRRFRGAAWRPLASQAGALALATVVGGYVFQLGGGTWGQLALPRDLVPVAALGAAYAAVRGGLLDVLEARETFHLDVVATAAETGFGSVLALFVLSHPWNALALVPLAAVVQRAHVRVNRVRRETLHALETFANIVDERDPSTYQHSLRVAGHVDALARALELPYSDIDRLRWAGRLHDLGKVAVDSSVLRKPERLDGAEWAAMRRHPRLSARLLQRFEFAAAQARAVEYHHERFDGSGYYGARGDELPLASHFLIVADSFDAMMTDRPYRPGLSREAALAEIERNVGTQFHPTVAKAFVAVQRGMDPARVVSADELEELRAACTAQRLPTLPSLAELRDRPELVAVGGVVLALAGIGIGRLWVAAAGAVVAFAGFALRAWVEVRAGRLGASLRAALAAAKGRDEVFELVVDRLEASWPLAWAALVSWHEHGLGGAVELRRGGAVPESVLMSWLVREAESGADFIIAPPFELGSDGMQVALPLRRDNSALVGFLVLASPRSMPRHVELALHASLDPLGLALATRPVEASASVEALAATAV